MMRRSTRHASAAASASGSQTGEPATSPSELFASPELQVALLPMLHSLDHCRLSLTCTNLRSILNTPEFAARVVTDVGPVKELLARARAIITGEESSPDVWLWQPPPNGDHLGGREPIERRSQDSIDDRWARGLIDMLEGNVDYLIVRDLRDQDGSDSESGDDSDWEGWDSSPLKLGGKGGRGGKGGLGGKGGGKGGRGRGRGDPPRSRAGTLARIAAMEAEPPLTWLRNVQTAMSRHYLGHEKGQVRTNQRFAWLHCVRYGLDGMLPQVLDARRKYEERMRRENPGRRRVQVGVEVKVDAFITFPRRRRSFFGAITPWQIRRNPLMLGAYLGHCNVMATLVRLGATCEWEDDITFEAFLTALDHNRRDVVRCFCTPRAAGGCGLSLNALPRRKGRLRLTASPCEIVWRHLMDDVDRRQYQQTWLGPDFDADELAYHGSRGRRRIRGGYVWQQTAAMVRLLAECGLPRRKFLPAVSDELLARCAAADDEGGLDTRTLPRQERRALHLLYEGAAEYNGQFEDEEDMLDLTQFKQLVLDLWPPGAAVCEDGSESEEGEEGEEGEDEGDSEDDDSDDS